MIDLKFNLTCISLIDTQSSIRCIGFEYDKFMSDVLSTTDIQYEYHQNYPEGLLHDKIASLLDDIEEKKYVDFPFLFSIELDKKISMLDCNCRYTFLFMDKKHLKKICREYSLDEETKNNCFSRDTAFIVVYTGMCAF